MTTAYDMANSPWIWLTGFLLGGGISFFSFLMVRRAYKAGLKIGMKKEDLRKAFTASATTVIGPSLGILVTMLGLIIFLGPGMAWLRESAGIGSIMYELIVAMMGMSSATGESLTPGLAGNTPEAFAAALFAMSVCCIPWLITIMVATPNMHRVRGWMTKRDPRLFMMFSIVMMLILFSNFTAPNLLKGGGNALATIIGAAVLVLIFAISDKLKKPYIKEFAIIISMLVAIFLCQWIVQTLGWG